MGKLKYNIRWKMHGYPEAETLTSEDGLRFRDLNKNGKLDVYEDPRQPIGKRVEDLLSQMTVEEKAGLMFSPQLDVCKPERIGTKGMEATGGSALEIILGRKINTVCAMGTLSPREFVRWHNTIQKVAECSRLGIPVTICSDPRHVNIKKDNPLAMQRGEGLSSWPGQLGFAAARDEKLVEEYAKIASEELRAIGIRFALHPALDTATEPRWCRISETYGEDAELNAKLGAAYVRGMQGKELGKESVACCIKHFPGGGPQKDGWDPHFSYGKEQVYPGGKFEYHMIPFKKVIREGVAAVMPYYGMPVGLDGIEEVGFNFNKTVTKDILRDQLGFDGIVHTDYSIIDGIRVLGKTVIPGRAWGCENLNSEERILKALDASVDQIGGEFCAHKLAKLVQEGRVPEERLDVSCRKILELKMRLGLFDHPYLDEETAARECNKPEHQAKAKEAMRRSLVLLKKEKDGKQMLPLTGRPKLYVQGVPEEIAKEYGELVNSPQDADAAVVWLEAPHRPDHRELLSNMFLSGNLEYTEKETAQLEKVMKSCPTIVVIHMIRPAVIPEIAKDAAGVLAEFDASADVVMDAIFGKFSPTGKLPFTLAASQEAILKQKSDTPFDMEEPLYPFGYGLTYLAT